MTAFANSVCFKIAEKKFETLSKANFYTPLVWFQTKLFFIPPALDISPFKRTFPLFFLVSREEEVNTRESVLTPPPAWNHLIPFQGQTCLGRPRIKRRNCPENNFSKKMLFLLLLYKVTVQLMTLLSGWPSAIWGTVFWWVRSQPANMTPLRQRPPLPAHPEQSLSYSYSFINISSFLFCPNSKMF